MQKKTWVLTVAALKTRQSILSGCNWANNDPGGGPNADFLGFAGTFVLESLGSPTRVSVFSFAPSTGVPVTVGGVTPWLTDSYCDPVTYVETLTFKIGEDVAGNGRDVWIAQDQDGLDIDVGMPVLSFARNANRDCPIGAFNSTGGIIGFDYPSLPILESTPV